jgi:UDP-glucose 4-epimerase
MRVSDLVGGVMRFKDAPQGVTTYNIGVDSQTNVTRIADIIVEEMGLTNVRYEYTSGRGGWKGDVPVFAYDLSKIRAAGWTAKYTSDEAVRLTAREELGITGKN